jgi:cell shape-determining protein MreD
VSETVGFFVGFFEDVFSISLFGVNALAKTLLSFFLNMPSRGEKIRNKALDKKCSKFRA